MRKHSGSKVSVTMSSDPYKGPTEQEKNSEYKRKYEFAKTPTNRSPVRGWEAEHLANHKCDQYCSHSKTEMDMVNKKPSGFGHKHIGGRAGKLRLSNSPGSHRIGARKK